MATIIIKNSTGSGAVPSSLTQGELAINVVDGKLFYGSGSGNSVKEFRTETGSFATTGSNTFNGNQIINGNVTVTGTASINTLVVNQTVLSTGSNQLGDAANDTQTLYGTVVIPTGSLFVSGAIRIVTTPSAGNILRPDNTGTSFQFGNGTNTSYGEYRFKSDGGTDLGRFLNTGNLGIGTITPTASLHISASTTDAAYSFLVQNSSGQTLIGVQNNRTVNINAINTANGDTAIGTTNGVVYINTGYNNAFRGNSITFYGGGDASTIQGWIPSQNGIAVGYAQTTTNPNTGSVFTVKGTIASSGSGVLFVTGSSTTRLLTLASEVSSSILVVSGSGNIGIGTTSPSQRLTVGTSDSDAILIGVGGRLYLRDTTTYINEGSGLNLVSGATRNIRLNAGGTDRLFVSASGNVGIGTTTPAYKLDVSGSTFTRKLIVGTDNTYTGAITGSDFYTKGTSGGTVFTVRDINNNTLFAAGGASGTGQFYVQSYNIGLGTGTLSSANKVHILSNGATSATTALLVQNSTPTTLFQIQDHGSSSFAGNMSITGSVRITGSAGLTVIGSGSTILDIQGSQGQLFSITDSLSGSLFSVNDISGLPILEVFSDSTTLIGDYLDPMLITTKKVTMTNSGSFVVYSLPTASYDTAFFDYSIKSGSNARAGQIMAIQSGASVNFTETTTTDFGNTTAVSFTVIVSGSNMVLTGSAATGSWTIKSIIRGL